MHAAPSVHLDNKGKPGVFFGAEISPLVAFLLPPSCGFLKFEFPVMTLALLPATAVFAKRTLSSADSCVFLHRPDLIPTLLSFVPLCVKISCLNL